jgi:hypothetical protein
MLTPATTHALNNKQCLTPSRPDIQAHINKLHTVHLGGAGGGADAGVVNCSVLLPLVFFPWPSLPTTVTLYCKGIQTRPLHIQSRIYECCLQTIYESTAHSPWCLAAGL